MVEVRRLKSDASVAEIAASVNRLFDLLKGNNGGRVALLDDDGVSRDIRGGAVLGTAEPSFKVRSACGEHVLIQHSDGVTTLLEVQDTGVTMLNLNLSGTLMVQGATELQSDLTLSGTSRRILADMSNATLASRLAFKTSTVNGETTLSVIPNGTNTTAGFSAYNNVVAGSATAAATLRATSSAVELKSESPAGAYLPLDLYTSGVKQVSIAPTTGIVTFTAAPVVPVLDPPTANGNVTADSQCKAYAFVAVAAGVAALQQNYNMVSVTRNGAGDFTMTIDRDFSAATYATLVTIQDNAAVLTARVNGQAVGSFDVHVRDSVTGVLTDPDGFSVAVFGILS